MHFEEESGSVFSVSSHQEVVDNKKALQVSPQAEQTWSVRLS